MALTDNLVSYWKLDEASGDAADSVGSNTLTNTGVVYATGKLNNGADFELSDTNDRLVITDASQSGLDITGDLSISLWFKPESAPATDTSMYLVTKYLSASNQRSYVIAYRDSGGGKELLAVISSTGGTGAGITSVVANSTLTPGTFYHIVLTQKSSATTALKIYLNGSEVATGASQSSIFNGSADFHIGNSANLDSEPDGIIDEVGIWSRVLTPTEIGELYNSGDGLQYPFVGFVENLTVSVSDQITISESVTVSYLFEFSVFDQITISESINVNEIFTLSVSDQLTITDYRQVIGSVYSATGLKVVQEAATSWATLKQTITIPKPTGLAYADLMVAHLTMATSLGDNFVTPSGWSGLSQYAVANYRQVVFWKIADANDVAASNFDFTISGPESVPSHGFIWVIAQGQFDVDDPIDNWDDSSTTDDDTPAFSQDVSQSKLNELFLFLTTHDSAEAIISRSLQQSNPYWNQVYGPTLGASPMGGASGIRPENTNTGEASMVLDPGDTPNIIDSILHLIAINTIDRAINTNDLVTVSEFVNVTFVLLFSVSDELTVSESVAITQVYNVSAADQLTMTETFTITNTALGGISVFDQINVQETRIVSYFPANVAGIAIMFSKENQNPLGMDETNTYKVDLRNDEYPLGLEETSD